ncbi:MAG: hypothetical protein NZ930_05275, partial [Candidatus Bipolaricaulota bacterium]|nr:hypothetical protein [Candidatus Bipolaricaulota bacterium]
GNNVTTCPALFSGTTATGGSDDFFRFQLPAGNYIAWVSVDEVPSAPPRAVSGWNSLIQFWVATNYPFFTQRPWVTGTGATPTTALNCDGITATGSPNPPSESCTVDPVYQAADTWPGAGVYSINVRPSAATTGTYRVLIVVWPAP